jgi:four helix bundle protein
MKSFKELEVFKAAKALAVLIYKTSQLWPKEEQFGLTSQIRRAGVSVPSNLSEGFGRVTSKDTYHFLSIARGSCYEIEAQIEIAFELGYVNQEQLGSIIEAVQTTCKLLNGTMNRYKAL